MQLASFYCTVTFERRVLCRNFFTYQSYPRFTSNTNCSCWSKCVIKCFMIWATIKNNKVSIYDKAIIGAVSYYQNLWEKHKNSSWLPNCKRARECARSPWPGHYAQVCTHLHCVLSLYSKYVLCTGDIGDHCWSVVSGGGDQYHSWVNVIMYNYVFVTIYICCRKGIVRGGRTQLTFAH